MADPTDWRSDWRIVTRVQVREPFADGNRGPERTVMVQQERENWSGFGVEGDAEHAHRVAETIRAGLAAVVEAFAAEAPELRRRLEAAEDRADVAERTRDATAREHRRLESEHAWMRDRWAEANAQVGEMYDELTAARARLAAIDATRKDGG